MNSMMELQWVPIRTYTCPSEFKPVIYIEGTLMIGSYFLTGNITLKNLKIF